MNPVRGIWGKSGDASVFGSAKTLLKRGDVARDIPAISHFASPGYFKIF